MRCGSTSVDKRPTPPINVNPANDTNNRLEVYEVWRGFHGGILPEAILVLCCIAGSDVREEDGPVPGLMYAEGFKEVDQAELRVEVRQKMFPG